MPENKLRGALKSRIRNDEYYTTYEEVKDIFERYIPNIEIKDKIIYCPCDSEKSNFVIYLKEHKEDLKYKELIYTSDDYNTHYDLFEKCDIIITNPPFSKLVKEFIPILNKVNKKFFIFGSYIGIHNYHRVFEIDVKYQRRYPYLPFLTPDNTYTLVAYLYIYNTDTPILNNEKNLIFKRPKEPNKAYDKEGNLYYEFKMLQNVPIDFQQEFLAPSTVFEEHNRQYLEYIKNIPPRLTFEDGKPRYVRCLVKLKNKYS